MHNVCLQLIGLRSTDGRQQNMPTCFEVSTIIVGDFSNENIHHLCYNIGTKISKTILHKSLQHYLCNARATFQLYQSLNFKLLLQLQLLFLHPSTPPTSITVVSPPSTPPTTIAIIAPINPSESSIAVTSSATATVQEISSGVDRQRKHGFYLQFSQVRGKLYFLCYQESCSSLTLHVSLWRTWFKSPSPTYCKQHKK